MSGLFTAGKAQAKQQPAVSGLQLQTSAYGKVIPIVYGTTRLAPNLGWYGDFQAIAHQSSPPSAGKGGIAGGGGKGGGGATTYTYQAAVVLFLCEGPARGVGQVWQGKVTTTLAALGLSFFEGDTPQAPWGYLETNHAQAALPYTGVAYVAGAPYQLGSSAELPNHNFEVEGVGAGTFVAGVADADPSLVVTDLLTNPQYGAGFPAARLGDLSAYRAYCGAAGLWISPAYADQAQASAMLDDIALYTNAEWVWSSGALTLVPRGDEALSGNGYTYAPPHQPLYDLGEGDFLSQDGDPVLLARSRPADQLNDVRIEFLDRANAYNPGVVEASDQAMIDLYGRRADQSRQAHLFADAAAARHAAQLLLQRQAVRNTYQFTLDERYVLLDPMDIVTLTDARLGLDRQWVRITEIAENDDGTLSFTAEEYLQGTAAAAAYDFNQGQGYAPDYNADPGNVNAPILFEPPDALAGGLEVWMAVSGGPLWGGADVWLSYDAESYRLLGRVDQPARMGTLAAPLPAVASAATGPTIDADDTLAVDLTPSRGEILSGTQRDALALNTLCYVDGELAAYQDAALVGPYRYDLTYLVRGAYGTPIAAHAAGARFARVDGALFKIPFTPDRIGQTIYLKLASVNLWGGGAQALSVIEPYAYRLTGAALASPLPDVRNLTTSYVASLAYLTWDEIVDFRPVLYEIRKGPSWTGAQILGRVAHPPFATQGDGTYWVAAWSQPAAGLQVLSGTPQDITIQGAVITSNVVARWDEKASGWAGSCGGAAGVGGDIVAGYGVGDVLAIADFLGAADLLHYGGVGSGSYEIPPAHQIDIGRAAPCKIMITWISLGVPVGQDVLTVGDFLGTTDVLGYAASVNTDIYPEIALSQDGASWGAWQKWTPGSYTARKFKARIQLATSDPQTIPILEGFTFAVDVPDRDDHYVGLAVPAAGLSLAFRPDGAAEPAPFNGGPSGAGAPALQVTILDAQAGDLASLADVSLAGCTLRILNGGAGVARMVNLLAQGY